LTDAARQSAHDSATAAAAPDAARQPDAARLSDAARLRWTSVPRWPVPELPAAASYLACCFGDAGERQARELLKGADRNVPVRAETFAAHWDTATEAALRRLIEESFTGVRVILAGPESVVMAAAALAKRLGATSEELVLIAADIPLAPSDSLTSSGTTAPAGIFVPSDTPALSGDPGLSDSSGPLDASAPSVDEYVSGRAARRVFCATCRASFDAVAAHGDIVTCPGCAVGLAVDRRFSRPHAAYFGWPTGLDLHQ
jgi:hypothetical protein